MDEATIASREEVIRKAMNSTNRRSLCRYLASLEGDRLIVEWYKGDNEPVNAWVTNVDCMEQRLRDYEPCHPTETDLKVFDLNTGSELGKVSRRFIFEES